MGAAILVSLRRRACNNVRDNEPKGQRREQQRQSEGQAIYARSRHTGSPKSSTQRYYMAAATSTAELIAGMGRKTDTDDYEWFRRSAAATTRSGCACGAV